MARAMVKIGLANIAYNMKWAGARFLETADCG
jgi:hypothetical protein